MTQTVPDISPLMPMHQDPLLVLFIKTHFYGGALTSHFMEEHSSPTSIFPVFMMTSSNGNTFRVTGFCTGNSPVTAWNSPVTVVWKLSAILLNCSVCWSCDMSRRSILRVNSPLSTEILSVLFGIQNNKEMENKHPHETRMNTFITKLA